MAVSSDVMKTILDGIVDVAYLINTEGKIVYMNASVREYGYSPEELVGINVFKLVHAQDRPKAIKALGDKKQGNGITEMLTVRLISKDGKPVPFEMKSKLIDLENGQENGKKDQNGNRLSGTYILGTARDVSGRKQVEQALNELNGQVPGSPAVSASKKKAASTRRLIEQLVIPGRDERLSRMMARS